LPALNDYVHVLRIKLQATTDALGHLRRGEPGWSRNVRTRVTFRSNALSAEPSLGPYEIVGPLGVGGLGVVYGSSGILVGEIR
jgi:hypothetical protein